ncbi:MAG: DUF296 domain-containing protein [Candidatus Omnitrophica bacterium]|nr:DUF296 domain-containing protein [Candidatus Omnitrophota bacterium]
MQAKHGRVFIGRFKYKEDLLGVLTGFSKKNNIRLGVFSVIGAVTCAKLGYYDQNKKKYVVCVDLKNKKLEIASCAGNISLLGKKIFVHAHVTLADHKGKTYAGHLMPGARIFAAEYFIQELKGKPLSRKFDSQTHLLLW